MAKNSPNIPVIIVTGPTASGKSDLSIALAQTFAGEIINADSMQVYKELQVLTGRPSVKDEAKAPHHLYGHVSMSSSYSTGIWLEHAISTIKGICKRDNLPIICGGTGLYLKVLKEGMASTPTINQKFFHKANSLFDKKGGVGALAYLEKFDPKRTKKLSPNDRQRIVRALSVFYATGHSLTYWQNKQLPLAGLNAAFFTIHLLPTRKQLYAVIDERFEKMIETGALKEIRSIGSLALDPTLPAMKALGVPELIGFLSGKFTIEAAVHKATQATRNLAKRQMSWLRNQTKPDLVVHDFANVTSIALAEAGIKKFLASPNS